MSSDDEMVPTELPSPDSPRAEAEGLAESPELPGSPVSLAGVKDHFFADDPLGDFFSERVQVQTQLQCDAFQVQTQGEVQTQLPRLSPKAGELYDITVEADMQVQMQFGGCLAGVLDEWTNEVVDMQHIGHQQTEPEPRAAAARTVEAAVPQGTL